MTEAPAPPLLALDDDALRGDVRAALDLAVLRATREGRAGVSVAAPPVVTADAEALPLHGIHVASLADAGARRFEASAVVVASRAETGQLFAASAWPPPQEAEPEPEPPSGDPPEGFTGRGFTLDLFDRPGLPRKPGSYVARLLVGGLASNAVRTELRASRFRDPEVERFLREKLLEAGPRPPWPRPGEASARYGDVPEAPPAPANGGVALAVDRVVLLERGARCMLRGGFRLVAHAHEVVREGHLPVADGERRPTAVVSVPVVVTGTAFAGPLVLDLALPSYDPVDPSFVVTGRFELDLLALPGMWRTPQTHFLYAVRGEHLAGPAVAAFVTPDMLP